MEIGLLWIIAIVCLAGGVGIYALMPIPAWVRGIGIAMGGTGGSLIIIVSIVRDRTIAGILTGAAIGAIVLGLSLIVVGYRWTMSQAGLTVLDRLLHRSPEVNESFEQNRVMDVILRLVRRRDDSQ